VRRRSVRSKEKRASALLLRKGDVGQVFRRARCVAPLVWRPRPDCLHKDSVGRELVAGGPPICWP